MALEEGKCIRLLAVDDHEVVRLGLRALFEGSGSIQVVGEAGTMSAAKTEAMRLKPDVILMDVRLPDGSGIDACRELKAWCPEMRILFFTSFADDEAFMATILAGADGYLLKEIRRDGLIRAIESVTDGHSILDTAVAQRMLVQLKSISAPVPEANHDGLSPQEQRVWALVAQGKTNKEIAWTLTLSEKTVKNYLSKVFQKLQVNRRSQAAALFAHQHAATNGPAHSALLG